MGAVATIMRGATPGSNTGLPSASLPSSGSYCLSSASRAFSSVAGGGDEAVASVRNTWRAITLFDSLLMSRTTS